MLTDKQQYVLDTITEFIGKNAKSPTIEELAIILNQKSKRGVVQYLEALEKKWFISRGRGYRSISLWNSVGFQTTINIPILGYANAGTPLVDAVESGNGFLPISKKILSGNEEDYFVLKVEGTSMNEFHIGSKVIDNGSYILIKKTQEQPNTRDAYVFSVNGGATVKKFKQEWENIYLLPESNDDYHNPIVLSSDDEVGMDGKVIEVFNF